jgi:hypothetical protein
LISLIGGGLLASFSLRTERALTDPGLDRADQDFFGRSGLEEPVPGAEAETEKLPTQRPAARPDAAEPGSEPPTLPSEEPPDSGPPEAGPPEPPGSSAGPPERA